MKRHPILLRVYGASVEHQDFPLPGAPVPPKIKDSTTESRSNPALKSITLHHKIRETTNPHHEKILAYDRKFKSRPEDVTLKELKAYQAVVTEASYHEIRQAEIVLCTCITASAPKFIESSFFRQVIEFLIAAQYCNYLTDHPHFQN